MTKTNGIQWRTEKRKISDLKPSEYNPRQASEKEWKDLDSSLTKFNLADPIIINRDDSIIGGHFRLRILKEKGTTDVDVRVPDRLLDQEEEKELNLRLNKNLGEWDYDLLANFDEQMLKNIGFDGDELDKIFGLDMDDDYDVEKELDKILDGQARRAKVGDLWQLGEHKLIIGNSTDRKVWERLMGKEKFNFMFTDPPYKIGYAQGIRKQKTKTGFKLQKMRSYPDIGKTDKSGKSVKGFGYKSGRTYKGVETHGGVPEYDEWLSIANDYQEPTGANVMVFESWKNTRELWTAIEKYWKVCNMVIWHLPNRHQGFAGKHMLFSKYDVAPVATKGDADYDDNFEPEIDEYLKGKGQKLLDTYSIAIYGHKNKSDWNKTKGVPWAKLRAADHVTGVASTSKSSGQNLVFGTKPLPILVPYVKILCRRDGIVMEPYGGSGSTMMACEIMHRRSRNIELSPIYAEVIINRWEKFTKQKALKL